MKVTPAQCIIGRADLPGDKSISHRSAMMAALCQGEVRIDNYSPSADCGATLNCLRAMGVSSSVDGSTVKIRGVGKHGLKEPQQVLDCSNSGTTMRLISGILAGQSFISTVSGDESLNSRPMKRIIEPITQMGANVESTSMTAPLKITGRRPLSAITYEPPVASAEIKSCVLLAGLFSDGVTSVVERVETRDHTERMLRWLGVDVETQDDNGAKIISVSGDAMLSPRDLVVPGDISAAAFFMVAAACLPGSDVRFEGVGFNPSRAGVVDVLRRLGVTINVDNLREVCNEPVAEISVLGGIKEPTSAAVIQGRVVANVIDELPVIAVLGTRLAHGLEVRDASELRVKETDRIAAVVANLRAMGATVREFADGFRVERSDLRVASVDSFGDHRIAMAFGVAGLLARAETEIIGAECIDVSFPNFFDTLAGVSVY